jgi:hypothetical protein
VSAGFDRLARQTERVLDLAQDQRSAIARLDLERMTQTKARLGEDLTAGPRRVAATDDSQVSQLRSLGELV